MPDTTQSSCPRESDARLCTLSVFPDCPSSVYQDPQSGEWFISDAQAARTILRDSNAKQAGFGADNTPSTTGRRAILYLTGERHRELRRKVAKLFSPKITREKYKDMMQEQAHRAVSTLQNSNQPLESITMEYSVAIAREIVGVTNSPLASLSSRLESFFVEPAPPEGWAGLKYRSSQAFRFWRFLIKDIFPAIRSRRREPQEDLISLLLQERYSAIEIAVECLTYAAAGMVTTREFISMAAWHLLRDEELKQRYLQSETKDRLRLLSELLRLDPIVRGLSRDLVRDQQLQVEGQDYLLKAGDRVHLQIPGSNTQDAVVGTCPFQVDAQRTMSQGFPDDVLSFGAGPHRCPGAAIAMQESDVFLYTLFQHPLELEQGAQTRLEALTASVSLRGLRVRIREGA